MVEVLWGIVVRAARNYGLGSWRLWSSQLKITVRAAGIFPGAAGIFPRAAGIFPRAAGIFFPGSRKIIV